MSQTIQPEQHNGKEPPPRARSEGAAKAHPATAGAAPKKAPPKKSAGKVAKSWPAVNALITIFSLTATLGGWAHFTVQEAHIAATESAAPPALAAPADPRTLADALGLPPIPTVVPLITLDPDSVTNAPASEAPMLRSVTAPPPVIRAPAPVASTRSSR